MINIDKIIKQKEKEVLDALRQTKKYSGLNESFAFTGAVLNIVKEVGFDVLKNAHTDAPHDCGADAIFVEQDSNGERTLCIYQGKSQKSTKFSTKEAIAILSLMDKTYGDLLNYKTKDVNELVRSTFYKIEDWDSMPCKLGLIVAKAYTDEEKEIITKGVELKHASSIEIIDENDIINALSSSGQNVKTLTLKLFNPESIITKPIYEVWNVRKFFLVISGRSLKEAALSNDMASLLHENLRMKVKDPKIDDAIEKSIEVDPELFNLKNQGLTLTCDSISFEENGTVHMKNASILNGGQTTEICRQTNFLVDNDIAIDCRVQVYGECDPKDACFIKPQVCIGNNSSKKPRSSDAYHSSRQLILTKKACEANGDKASEFQIKRGENYKLDVPKFAKTDLESLGQLLLAGKNLTPVTAHNSKNEIFEKEKVFNKVFPKDGVNPDIIYDLLLENSVLNKLIKDKIKETENDLKKQEKWVFCKNISLHLIALVSYCYQIVNKKSTFKEVDKEIFNASNPDEIAKELIPFLELLADYSYKNYKIAAKKGYEGFNKYSKNQECFSDLVEGLDAFMKTKKASTVFKKCKSLFAKA